MRISDWSSDVCSSDLRPIGALALAFQMRRGAGGNAIVRPRRVMPTPATVTRRPRIRRLCFVARSCSPQSSSGVADARLSRLVMVATSHCLGLRPCVEVVDLILDDAAVQPEDRSLAGAPQPLPQPAGAPKIRPPI